MILFSFSASKLDDEELLDSLEVFRWNDSIMEGHLRRVLNCFEDEQTELGSSTWNLDSLLLQEKPFKTQETSGN